MASWPPNLRVGPHVAIVGLDTLADSTPSTAVTAYQAQGLDLHADKAHVIPLNAEPAGSAKKFKRR